MTTPFSVDIESNWEDFLTCIRRTGNPKRVHHMELFLDPEVQDAICARYDVDAKLDKNDPEFPMRREIALQSFLGYDYIRCGADNIAMSFTYHQTEDTSSNMKRNKGRMYMDGNRGPITNWEEFEKYPWPEIKNITTRTLEWYEKNLPENMCIVAGGGFGHFAEHLSWLMGYTTFCMALFENRDLVQAIYNKLSKQDTYVATLMTQFSCVKALWGSDDMGFKGGPLVSPPDMREFVLAGHKTLAKISHDSGRPYLLHSCGKLDLIMDDLIHDVKIDAKHSFEDVIEPVTEAKKRYGKDIALLGGIDVDFLCRASEEETRARVRDTLNICQEDGGYCLGTGNSVANYIPLDNYLAMLDEGRRF
ncbi:MAG: uroporphyrinogen-III decarboxylase-like protein [Candidatus Hydrogenedentes bacterium]|nr:uroporphyrinogen-III decarboxylase-like protein [Candidatus Hydrogenedentota bacterium]